MKLSDKVLLFLVKNSKPEYHECFVSSTHDYLDNPKEKTKKEKLQDLLLSVSGTTRYCCESLELEKFLGEQISWKKHLLPLQKNKILYFEGSSSGDDKLWDAHKGQVKDYTTGISYVAFHYKENDFLKSYDQIKENAEKLKLL